MPTIVGSVTGKRDPRYTVPNLQGRTAVVTGGTTGIGFEVAKALALAKARVLLLCRREESGEEANSKINASEDGRALHVDLTFVECDLSSLAHVKEVGDQIREQEERLDLLILAEEIGLARFELSADEIERHFATNHLAHFLLANLLLPLVRRTARLPHARAPRIVAVSAEQHRTPAAAVKFATFGELTTDLGAHGLYARSKLANILFVKYALVERVLRATKPSGGRILALATHGGVVPSTRRDHYPDTFGTVLGNVMKHLTSPSKCKPEEACRATLWAATSEEVERESEKWNGRYVVGPGELREESRAAQSPELGKNLWMLSNLVVKKKLGDGAMRPWDECMKGPSTFSANNVKEREILEHAETVRVRPVRS